MRSTLTSYAQSSLRQLRIGELQPGHGSQILHIGQSEGSVRDLLGAPDQIIDKFQGNHFFVYSALGVDVDFLRPGGSAARLFFYRAGVENHHGEADVGIRGIKLGATERKLLEVFGEPADRGGPVKINRRFKYWLTYSTGVQFDLTADQRISIIIIFDPRLKD